MIVRKGTRKLSTFLNLSLTLLFALILIISGFNGVSDVNADTRTTGQNAYKIIIDDGANLLTDAEEKELLTIMNDITVYGNVAFVTTSYNNLSASSYATNYFSAEFGHGNNGALFLIDMDNREIYLKCGGKIANVVTSSYCDSITDNTYRYAKSADYFKCAYKSFEQVYKLMAGQKIAQPMKYICNAFIALAFAVLLNYFIAKAFNRARMPRSTEILSGAFVSQEFKNKKVHFINQTKTYSPQSSSSGGSSGGGGGGGGGGSSSGGGHSF